MVLVIPERRRLRPFSAMSVGALAAVKLALHSWVNVTTSYGFHRDELLYLAMGRHLQLWRMDFPPGIAAMAEASRALLGDSLLAIESMPGGQTREFVERVAAGYWIYRNLFGQNSPSLDAAAGGVKGVLAALDR